MRNPFQVHPPVRAPFGRVMVAKTTHLGDLVIGLPLASALKRHDPGCTVIYLTNPATVAVARYCPDIDEVYPEPASPVDLAALLVRLKIDVFIQVNAARSLAKAAFLAAIPTRIGSLFRAYNVRYCTDLVAISRPWAQLNKRQLDLQYLAPLGIKASSMDEVATLVQRSAPRRNTVAASIHPRQFAGDKHAIILSPSLVTARGHQWPLAAFSSLIERLGTEGVHWFICGIDSERAALSTLLSAHAGASNVTDLVGKLSLQEFIGFTAHCDGLIAGSTGPLHLAAALGLHTLGLFSSDQADLQRWEPIGTHADVIHSKVPCKQKHSWNRFVDQTCPCILAIDAASVAARVHAWCAHGGQLDATA